LLDHHPHWVILLLYVRHSNRVVTWVAVIFSQRFVKSRTIIQLIEE
jgi:hypothetical protein